MNDFQQILKILNEAGFSPDEMHGSDGYSLTITSNDTEITFEFNEQGKLENISTFK